MSRSKLGAAALAGVVLLTSQVAEAGLRVNQAVEVVTSASGGYLRGTFADTRALPDTRSTLWCKTTVDATGQQADCLANSPTRSASCRTRDPVLTRAISRLKTGAYVLIRFDSTGGCSSVETQFGSPYPPKQP